MLVEIDSRLFVRLDAHAGETLRALKPVLVLMKGLRFMIYMKMSCLRKFDTESWHIIPSSHPIVCIWPSDATIMGNTIDSAHKTCFSTRQVCVLQVDNYIFL